MTPSSRWRIGLLAVVVVGVSLAHYLTPVGGHDTHEFHPLHAVYRWCYHLPIILAAFWFGLRGGVIAGVVVTVLYLPHVLFQWNGGTAEQWLEIALYNVVGWVTGFLAQGQRTERDRYRRTAERLDEAFAELKERTRSLLETEDQLRHAARLSAIGELSASLAHEIKTPLASIRGAAEIFADGRADGEERREFSLIMQREVDRLSRVLGQFLEFARPKGSAAPVANLHEAVEEVLDLTRAERSRRGIEVRSRLAEGLPLVSMEPEQLRQVILNLAMNSLQAMEDGGFLEVSTVSEAGRALLAIRDSGRGIPDEIRDRLFDPFVTGRAKGTGLGLSIVKRILDQHGATIGFRAAEGGGTLAEVSIPVLEAENDRS